MNSEPSGQPQPSANTEPDRVAARYAVRADNPKLEAIYTYMHPATCLVAQERQRALIALLSESAAHSLDELTVLEVGCGAGKNLLELICLGFDPEHLVGNELLDERVAIARRNLPALCRVVAGDASALPFAAATFDIVYVSTVFSSLLDAKFQQLLANRIWDWVKPGGGVLWYDFIYNNPSNADVRGVPIKRLKELFPDGAFKIRRVTLAPPIGRRSAMIHPAIYKTLNLLPFLRSHVLCWVGKPRADN